MAAAKEIISVFRENHRKGTEGFSAVDNNVLLYSELTLARVPLNNEGQPWRGDARQALPLAPRGSLNPG